MSRKKRLPAVIEKDTEGGGHLTDKQLAFAQHYAATGELKGSAVAAGYAEAGASVEANRLMKNPLIVQEIMQQVRERFVHHAPVAVNAIDQLARSAKSEMVKLLAAQDLLDRAGLKAPEKHMHAIAGELTVSIDLT